MEFRYYMPVKTFFGRNCIKNNSAEFTRLGKKALIVTGKSSAEKNGSLDDVKEALEGVNISYSRFNGIGPNPSVEDVRAVSTKAKDSGADFIIGIGGGSPLDAAKAGAILAANDISDEEMFNVSFKNRPLPVAAVPTTAGTGSEVTPYSILTYNKISNKKNVASDYIFPVCAFLDPSYTATLSRTITINTAVDALSHALEGYLAARATDVVKPYSLESIRLIGECLHELSAEEISYSAREKLLYASMLAGIVIAHTGTTAVHAMGYPLTYHRNIDHGRANGLVLYHYLKFVGSSQQKVKDILDAMKIKTVDEFGSKIESLLGEKEYLTDEELELFTETAMSGKNIANTVPVPGKNDIKEIFENSFRKRK